MPAELNSLQVLGLVAMSAMKSRSEIDPCEYYGVKEFVEPMIGTPIDGLRLVIKRACGLPWDGKAPLWAFLVEALRQDCLLERSHAMFGKTCKEINLAYAYVKHFEQLKNVDFPPETLSKVEHCRRIVIGTVISRLDDIPRFGDEAESKPEAE